MKRVERFQAEDGKVFDSADECVMYERSKEFVAYMHQNKLASFEPDRVFEWMFKHRLAVRKLVAPHEDEPPVAHSGGPENWVYGVDPRTVCLVGDMPVLLKEQAE